MDGSSLAVSNGAGKRKTLGRASRPHKKAVAAKAAVGTVAARRSPLAGKPSSAKLPASKPSRRRALKRATVVVGAGRPPATRSPDVASPAVGPQHVPPKLTRRSAIQPVSGSSGDHPAVQQLLAAVQPGFSREAFQATLEDPFYEPPDRLLAKQGEELVGHVQITRRSMHFGSMMLPVGGIHWLAVLPEHRAHGHARQLLRLAEAALDDDGAAVDWLSTRIPHFFCRSGWAVCGRHNRACARTRELLAQLSTAGWAPGVSHYSIRPWRQVELPALMRLYADRTASMVGPLHRTEAYWRWLVSRQDATQVLIAIDGPDKFDLASPLDQIVGYAVTADDRILELMVSPGHRPAAEALLARACGDLIERDMHSIELHAPGDEPLFELFRAAGGNLSLTEVHEGEVFMARLANPIGFLQLLADELSRRADAAQLARPCELGLDVEGQRCRLIVSRRGVRVGRNKLGRSYLRLRRADLTRLVLGHLDLEEAVGSGRISASTRLARQMGAALFPRLAWWRPPLDELLLK